MVTFFVNRDHCTPISKSVAVTDHMFKNPCFCRYCCNIALVTNIALTLRIPAHSNHSTIGLKTNGMTASSRYGILENRTAICLLSFFFSIITPALIICFLISCEISLYQTHQPLLLLLRLLSRQVTTQRDYEEPYQIINNEQIALEQQKRPFEDTLAKEIDTETNIYAFQAEIHRFISLQFDEGDVV